MSPSFEQMDTIIDIALSEDIGAGDITSLACVPETSWSEAVVVAKKPCVMAGGPLFARVFSRLDPQVVVKCLAKEGHKVYRGKTLLSLGGPSRAVLAGERTAMNFLSRLCGIASLTRKFVERAANPEVAVLDTRKTCPGMRAVDKYAVLCGGGRNHRMGLYDQVLIKENHIAAAGGILLALGRAKAIRPRIHVQVEVRNLEELVLAVEGGADSVLLDNMSPDEVRNCCRLVGRRVPVEVSGGISLKNIREYAATGVDRISVGALTHSAPAADLSMLFIDAGRQT